MNFTLEQFKQCVPALYPTTDDKNLLLTGFNTSAMNEQVVSMLLDDRKFCENKLALPITLSFSIKEPTAIRFKETFSETRVMHQKLVQTGNRLSIETREVKLPKADKQARQINQPEISSPEPGSRNRKIPETHEPGAMNPGKTNSVAPPTRNGVPVGVLATS